MTVYRASWVLPVVSDPIAEGWVAIEDGLVAGIGGGDAPGAVDLGHAVILPALVNAHTHLELSYLRGAVPPADQFLEWIGQVIAARQRLSDPEDAAVLQSARVAIQDAKASGTGLIGDVSNTLVTVPLLREAAVPARVFYELLGFNPGDPVGKVRDARARVNRLSDEVGGVRVSLAAHAPYSVSPALFAAIRDDLDAHHGDVSSVHVGESADEVEFMTRGTGGWRAMLMSLGAWSDAWRPPGVTPATYLADLGFLDSRVLAVHAVQCDGEELSRLATLGATIVSCPRSSRHVGVGDPPLEAFYAMGVRVAFGTDSLASVADMNMFTELAAARRIAPRVSARDLIESATLSGARALGFGEQYGSIEEGKRAGLIAVRMPGGVSDPEDHLLSGVEPAAVSWLGPEGAPS
ncbi:MAG: amidohydrolase family protein [Acidobacteria bacterium]|nr:amidohydrolase family protein [Acidobacteriota bacterium]